jgi:hypothetical protein
MQFIGLRKGIITSGRLVERDASCVRRRGNNSPRERACRRERDFLDPEVWLPPETIATASVQ